MSVKKQSKKASKWLIPGVIIVAAVVVIAAIFILGQPPEKTTPLSANINVSEAAERFENGAYLLDVRQPEEWVAGHVEGAILIPLGELESRLSEIPTDRDVLIICRSGNRSTEARGILRAAGLERSASVMGGMNAWLAEGLPVVTGE